MRLDDTRLEQWRADLDARAVDRPLRCPGRRRLGPHRVRGRRRAQRGRAAPAVRPHPHGTLEHAAAQPAQHVRRDTARRRAARSPKLTFPDGRPGRRAGTGGRDGGADPRRGPLERHVGRSRSSCVTPASSSGSTGPVVLTAHVNALTGLGQVITGGALLVLGSWWFGHFRRRRRQRLARPRRAASVARHACRPTPPSVPTTTPSSSPSWSICDEPDPDGQFGPSTSRRVRIPPLRGTRK